MEAGPKGKKKESIDHFYIDLSNKNIHKNIKLFRLAHKN